MSDNCQPLPSAMDVAIIAVNGRFPGANTPAGFWQNLASGTESIFPIQLPGNQNGQLNSRYSGGRLEGADLFDASFFGFNPREAVATDPQHRVLLECAWEAMEMAGYDSGSFSGSVGVFVGASPGWYGYKLFADPVLMAEIGGTQFMIGNSHHFLATRISYKLDLQGPSIAVLTACSTSLAAVHLACQSLMNGECDMALAGGVGFPLLSMELDDLGDHDSEDGGIMSANGHCSAFDAAAQGTVMGDGAGLIVLRRLDDAIRDGDFIHAVIKATAINNDGAQKAGYTAPSVEGQARAISEALAMSRISPETITYVEAHGTGTPIGDPIELRSLTQAFSNGTQRRQFCAIGSVKTNVGHLDAAAGITGLIKTVLALQHGAIPASLHFENPNPLIDFKNSPFYVNRALSEWKLNGTPRRALVNAFGFGGTNVCAILEEATERPPSGESRPYQVWTLSAKTKAALNQATANLADYFSAHKEVNLADVAYTLQVGRRRFCYQRAFVSHNREDMLAALKTIIAQPIIRLESSQDRPVRFLFPGQGAQYIDMGRELLDREDSFRTEMEDCCSLIEPLLGLRLLEVLYPSPEQKCLATKLLSETRLTQPALFIIEYCLARLWMRWGIHPEAMLGHSIGEYVAACLAGVFTLEEGLRLVASRGRLIQELSPGAMLAVALGEDEIHGFLNRDISLAVVSSPAATVLAGNVDAIQRMKEALLARGVEGKLLDTSHAFHSHMMEPALEAFDEALSRVTLKPPSIRYLSNVTGTWVTAADAQDPKYWVRHLRQTVRVGDGMRALLQDSSAILLEVGPGRTLGSLVKANAGPNATDCVLVQTLRHPREVCSDQEYLLKSLAVMWCSGASLDWPAFYAGESRHRVQLPTYPFEKQSYWIQTKAKVAACSAKIHEHEMETSDRAPRAEPCVSQAFPRPSLDSVYVAPHTESEKKVCELWEKMLGIRELGIDDNFFDLGGHSLIATQLISRLQKSFSVEISLEAFFDNQTVCSLAAAIDRLCAAMEPKQARPMPGRIPRAASRQRQTVS